MQAIDALRAAVADGTVRRDGFEAGHDDAGYWLETPDDERRELGEDTFRAAAAEHEAYVTNWWFWRDVAPANDAEFAFCRWLEGADESAADRDATAVPERYDALTDGLTRSWGELQVTVRADTDGRRRYEIRHSDDADADPDTLETHDDPQAARDLAKADSRGRYRPLKTAPSLRTGWRFGDLAASGVVRIVEVLYPATIANWHREREGTLDIDHWRDTMRRQTGIYGVIDTWDRGEGYEHVNWVAEACCDDSQCLKRREWEYDDETDLDVDGGDGEFPCREPCSLVISAARKWTRLEGEQPETYTFELTPSEKEQLDAIVNAVADGRIDDIREADVKDGANRYRARYLRAKLFEDGELPPTVHEE
jgi:hypothetical protein